MRGTFSVLTQDNPGVLVRVASLIYQRNYNIVSISASPTGIPDATRITLVIDGDEWMHEQVERHLSKLMEVLAVENLNEHGRFTERQITLIKVAATIETRPAIIQTAEVFRGRVVDMSEDTITIETTGSAGKAEALIEALRPYGILEHAGSGSVALSRGSRVLHARSSGHAAMIKPGDDRQTSRALYEEKD